MIYARGGAGSLWPAKETRKLMSVPKSKNDLQIASKPLRINILGCGGRI